MCTIVPRENPSIVLGETHFRGRAHRFGLTAPDRLRHLYVLGVTGAGKSTLLESLIRQDLARGECVAVLDPHGTLVQAVLPFVPPHAHALVLEPGTSAWTTPWNPLRATGTPAARTSAVVGALKRQWADSWGPRLEHLLRNALLAVLPHPRASFLLLYRFVTELGLRDRMVDRVTDPLVRTYWTQEFAGYTRALQAEALAPLQNKLGAFLASPVLRRVFGFHAGRADLAHIIQNRGVLLAALPAAELGADAAGLLGALLVSELGRVVMERGAGNHAVYLYVDEFQTFATDHFGTLLAEARKFGLGMTLAHQFRAQLPPFLQSALRGNVGSSVCFRLGREDADELAPDLAPFSPDDLTSLPPFHTVVRQLGGGVSLPAFSAKTIAVPPATPTARANAIRVLTSSRARYGVRSARIDDHIAAQMPDAPR